MRLSGLRRMVIINVALTSVALVFAGFVPFAFNLAVGRVEGPNTLGALSAVLGLAMFLGQIPGTLSAATTKFTAEATGRENEEAARHIFQFLFVVTCVLGLLLAAAVLTAQLYVAHALHVDLVSIFLTAILIPVYSLYLFLKSAYYGLQRVPQYVINEILSDTAFFALLAVLLTFHASTWLLSLFVLNNVVFVLIALRDLRPFFSPFDWHFPVDRWTIVRYCLMTGGGSAASLGRWSLGSTVTGMFLSHADVGLYAAALSLVSPLQLAPRALSLVNFATMARLYAAGRDSTLRNLLQGGTEALVLVVGVVCGLACINASTTLGVLFTGRFVGAAVVLQMVLIGSYVGIICGPASDALSSTKFVLFPTLASIAGLVISAALWLIFVPRVGIVGAALGFLSGAVATGGLPVVVAVSRMNAGRGPYLRAALIMSALVATLILLPNRPVVGSEVFLAAVFSIYAPTALALLPKSERGETEGAAMSRSISVVVGAGDHSKPDGAVGGRTRVLRLTGQRVDAHMRAAFAIVDAPSEQMQRICETLERGLRGPIIRGTEEDYLTLLLSRTNHPGVSIVAAISVDKRLVVASDQPGRARMCVGAGCVEVADEIRNVRPDVTVYVGRLAPRVGCLILLNGELAEHVGERELREAVARGFSRQYSPQDAARRLVSQAVSHGAQDASALVLQIRAQPISKSVATGVQRRVGRTLSSAILGADLNGVAGIVQEAMRSHVSPGLHRFAAVAICLLTLAVALIGVVRLAGSNLSVTASHAGHARFTPPPLVSSPHRRVTGMRSGSAHAVGPSISHPIATNAPRRTTPSGPIPVTWNFPSPPPNSGSVLLALYNPQPTPLTTEVRVVGPSGAEARWVHIPGRRTITLHLPRRLRSGPLTVQVSAPVTTALVIVG